MSSQPYPRAHSLQRRTAPSEACHSSHPSACDIRVTFSPHCGIVGGFTLNPYLAEMKKSKRNQLTGGEETLGENVPQLLLCCWGLHVAVVGGITGTGDEWAEDGAQSVMRDGAGVAVCLGVDGPQVGAWQGG